MGTSEFYRTEAERCRALAARGGDAAVRRRWHQLADEYDQLARALEGGSVAQTRPGPLQQAMQQQQSKAKPDKD
jgi:hypothetical protein